jgi:exosortase/archaeosortase family protein
MFMDDACSGVISLLTSMACAALLSIWRSRGLVHFFTLGAIGALWALVFNIARVVCLLCSWQWFSIDLTTGWRHDLIGYLALLGGVLCIVLSDIALNYLLQDTTESRSQLTGYWNRFIANPAFSPESSVIQKRINIVPMFIYDKPGKLHFLQIAVVIVLIAVQIPKEVKAWNARSRPLKEFSIASIRPVPFPGAFLNWIHVPEQDRYQLWRQEYHIKSTQATYRRGNEMMIVAVAYPYDHWHDITKCYEGTNWKIDDRETTFELPDDAKNDSILDSVVHLEMRRGMVERATVLFAFFDPQGEPIPAPRPATGVVDVLRSRFGFDDESHPNFQGFLIQAIWPRGATELAPRDLEGHRRQFREIVNQLRIQWTRDQNNRD